MAMNSTLMVVVPWKGHISGHHGQPISLGVSYHNRYISHTPKGHYPYKLIIIGEYSPYINHIKPMFLGYVQLGYMKNYIFIKSGFSWERGKLVGSFCRVLASWL